MQNPLNMAGVDIDPVSRQPATAERLMLQQIAKEKITARANELISDLAGEGGAMVNEIVTLFVKRVNQLMTEDPECNVYREILDSVKFKLDAADRIVAQEMGSLKKYAK